VCLILFQPLQLYAEVYILKKKQYQTAENDINEMEKKIRAHKIRITSVVLIIIFLCLTLVVGLYFYRLTKEYSSYQVLQSEKREDAIGTNYLEYKGNILKYSNDGATYQDQRNRLIWNQAYEMQKPIVDICEDYVGIADEKGNKIYIMDTNGPVGQINTTRPIQQIHIANQGVVAVLMKEDGGGVIQLYDKNGTPLVESVRHIKKGGYPMDISISNDGKKLAISLLDWNEGNIKTTIAFYYFDETGQNEIDKVMGVYSYENVMVPKIEFFSNNLAIAFGDTKVAIYELEQQPKVRKEIEIKQKIQKVFLNESYFGLVFNNDNAPESVSIYDLNGKVIQNLEPSLASQEVYFLENDEICIRNELSCEIYTLRGVRRFHYTFSENVWQILSAGSYGRYILLMEKTTDLIKLK
jgi:hypothetical protein